MQFYEDFSYPSTIPYLDWEGRLKPSRLCYEFPNDPDYSIIVAGCGTVEAAILAKQNPEKHIIGVDSSANSLRICEGVLKASDIQNVSLIHSNYIDYVPEGSVDAVVASGVIHHNKDHVGFIRKVKSDLKKNGHLVGMVYAKKERGHIWKTRKKFKDFPCNADGVRMVREYFAEQPSTDASKQWFESYIQTDEEIADTWLNPYAIHFSSKNLREALTEAGMLPLETIRSCGKLAFSAINVN